MTCQVEGCERPIHEAIRDFTEPKPTMYFCKDHVKKYKSGDLIETFVGAFYDKDDFPEEEVK